LFKYSINDKFKCILNISEDHGFFFKKTLVLTDIYNYSPFSLKIINNILLCFFYVNKINYVQIYYCYSKINDMYFSEMYNLNINIRINNCVNSIELNDTY